MGYVGFSKQAGKITSQLSARQRTVSINDLVMFTIHWKCLFPCITVSVFGANAYAVIRLLYIEGLEFPRMFFCCFYMAISTSFLMFQLSVYVFYMLIFMLVHRTIFPLTISLSLINRTDLPGNITHRWLFSQFWLSYVSSEVLRQTMAPKGACFTEHCCIVSELCALLTMKVSSTSRWLGFSLVLRVISVSSDFILLQLAICKGYKSL